MIHIKSKEDIEIMTKNGALLAGVLDHLKGYVVPGVSTGWLDQAAEEFMRDVAAVPSFKGYKGFPATICASIGYELIHGIPNADRFLEEGQIISIDIGLYKDGFHADAARTWPVGKIHYGAEYMIQSVNRILQGAVELITPGIHLGDISSDIQLSAEARGFDVVRNYGGHGIGRNLHEDPHIPNHGFIGSGPILKEGMVLAIEPMIKVGDPDVEVLDDGWTVVSKDRRLNAHAEDTVVVTSSGCEILTRA